ncbi:hypothetical protein [Streptomyces apocyni]|uniref:hypothetical protein n=1 Tax=Streptomyces apocyni TaxID=2654677 RepID=UPI0012E9F206|nr:hypothetical protein [Streptomyces apocyni]
MTTRADSIEAYAHLWQASSGPHRWVLWTTAEETMVFDRELNCPEDVDEPILGEVMRRMREVGVPETGEYPGRSCGRSYADRP